jgi:hypothetical protein
MGGAPSSGFSYPKSILERFDKSLSSTINVVDTLLSLNIGQDYNISYLADIPLLQSILPEFNFIQVSKDLYKARRSLYLGDSSRCCITNEQYYTIGNSIITCPPALKSQGTNRSCDFVLSNYCFNNPVNINICQTWFEGYIRSNGYDIFTNQGYEFCKTKTQREPPQGWTR